MQYLILTYTLFVTVILSVTVVPALCQKRNLSFPTPSTKLSPIFPTPTSPISKLHYIIKVGDVTVEYNRIVKIVVYTDSFCKECREVIKFLKENKVKFEERDFWSFTGFFDRTLHGYTAPITEITYSNGTSRKIIGFDKKILSTLIESPSKKKSGGFDLRNDTGNLKGTSNDSFDVRMN